MYPEAAKIVRLLEGARLVIDLDASSLGRQGLGLGYPASGQGLGVSTGSYTDAVVQSNSPVKPPSQVESVRAALARKWTALLIGSSLNKLQNKVTTKQLPPTINHHQSTFIQIILTVLIRSLPLTLTLTLTPLFTLTLTKII